MKRLPVSILVTMFTLSLLSCSSSGAPDCSDGDVMDLVIDIAEQEFRKQLFTITQIQISSVERKKIGQPGYKGISESDLTNMVNQDLDKKVSSLNMELEGIRTNGKNNEIKKSECGATINFSNGNDINIEYIAQYTDDDEIYVEVFGL
jgi:hypothetical protein